MDDETAVSNTYHGSVDLLATCTFFKLDDEIVFAVSYCKVKFNSG